MMYFSGFASFFSLVSSVMALVEEGTGLVKPMFSKQRGRPVRCHVDMDEAEAEEEEEGS